MWLRPPCALARRPRKASGGIPAPYRLPGVFRDEGVYPGQRLPTLHDVRSVLRILMMDSPYRARKSLISITTRNGDQALEPFCGMFPDGIPGIVVLNRKFPLP